jgi:predicted permease
MSNFVHDLRYGLRMIVKQPTVSVIAILALALGIGLTTTMYSIVHGALGNLPFDEAHELINLEQTNPSQEIESMALDHHDFLDWREQQTTFEDLAAFYQGTINVAGTESPIRFEGAFMMAEAFTLLGVEAQLGRVFSVDDQQPGADAVLLIGHDVWQNNYAGDPGVVGTEVRVNGRPGTIIGVMPAGFAFPMAEEAWTALVIDTTTAARGQNRQLAVLGRLKDNVDIETALAELQGISERLEAAYPDSNEGVRANLMPFVRDFIDGRTIALLWTMQGAVFMVLLIACANVANLLLSRALDRSREVAVRTALGASRGRVISQMLTETLIMSAIGGMLGLGIAQVGVTWFNGALAGVQVPFWVQVSLDWPVLVFAAITVFTAALLAGVMPAWQITGANLNDVLKDETRGSSSFRMGRISRALVIAEVAFSCGLLVGAGLMIKSVTQLQTLDPGFPTELFTSRMGVFATDYPEVEQRRQFFTELQQRLGEQPGIVAVALGDALPGTYRASMSRLTIEGEAYAAREDHPVANFATVTPGFFDTFETRLLQGRDFSPEDDGDGLAVAIVNQSFVNRFLAGTNPIGQRFKLGSEDDDGNEWRTVVGVVPDMYMEGIGDPGDRPPQGFYVPIAQEDRRFMSIAARGTGDSMRLVDAVRDAIAGIDANVPLYWVRTLQAEIDENTWFYNVFGALFMVFGAVALFLAAIGLYGVMSFSVSRREQEVGIRMALGAQARDVLGLVVKQGLWQVATGLTLGLGLAVLASGGLELVLFEVNPRDLTVYGLVLAALGATGLLACLLPAARASRVAPVEALRS